MGIFDLVFPKLCLGCGKNGGYICTICVGRMAKAREKCSECARYSYGGKTHQSCRQKRGLEGVVSVYRYEGLIRKAILKLKYNFVSELAEELGLITANELKKTGLLKGKRVVLVPVPLSGSRGRWRGFNQAAEMGKVVAREMCWNYAEILTRKKKTDSQTGFNREKRQENVKEAFCLKANSLINSSYVYVVFDDVWTTGATMKECGKILKKGRVREVWGLSVAN